MNDESSCPICGCIDGLIIKYIDNKLLYTCPCCGNTISNLDFLEGALNSYN